MCYPNVIKTRVGEVSCVDLAWNESPCYVLGGHLFFRFQHNSTLIFTECLLKLLKMLSISWTT
jgi:hypothetical protein